MGFKKVIAWILIILGLLVVFGTHIWMLMSTPFTAEFISKLSGHAYTNIVAGILILFGIILKK